MLPGALHGVKRGGECGKGTESTRIAAGGEIKGKVGGGGTFTRGGGGGGGWSTRLFTSSSLARAARGSTVSSSGGEGATLCFIIRCRWREQGVSAGVCSSVAARHHTQPSGERREAQGTRRGHGALASAPGAPGPRPGRAQLSSLSCCQLTASD